MLTCFSAASENCDGGSGRRAGWVAQSGLSAATKLVGTSSTGSRPNAVRPYIAREMFAKKQEFTGLQCRWCAKASNLLQCAEQNGALLAISSWQQFLRCRDTHIHEIVLPHAG